MTRNLPFLARALGTFNFLGALMVMFVGIAFVYWALSSPAPNDGEPFLENSNS